MKLVAAPLRWTHTGRAECDVIGDRLAPPDGHMAAPTGPRGTQALASCMATHPASAIQQAGSMHRNAEKVVFVAQLCACL